MYFVHLNHSALPSIPCTCLLNHFLFLAKYAVELNVLMSYKTSVNYSEKCLKTNLNIAESCL
jgi:hypothetical protein